MKKNLENCYIDKFPLTLIVSATIFTSVLEEHFLSQISGTHTMDHYLSTSVLSISLFLLFFNLWNNENILTRIGKDYSLYIYLYHPLVVLVFVFAKPFLMVNSSVFTIISIILPIIVFCLTYFLIATYFILKENYYDK